MVFCPFMPIEWFGRFPQQFNENHDSPKKIYIIIIGKYNTNVFSNLYNSVNQFKHMKHLNLCENIDFI